MTFTSTYYLITSLHPTLDLHKSAMSEGPLAGEPQTMALMTRFTGEPME
jgi:hypothetical protein